jgi:hypothetical protein
MGLFSRSKKSKEELEQEKEQNQLEHKIEQQKNDHSELSWPQVPAMNPMLTEGKPLHAEDELSEEDKERVGNLVYLPTLMAEDVKSLKLQELLYLITTMEYFNKEIPLENFTTNRSVVIGEVMNRLREAKEIYVIYDEQLPYPLIDTGMISIYLEKEHAEKAVELYKKQYRKVKVRNFKMKDEEGNALEHDFFEYTYYIGTNNIWLENGFYRMRIRSIDMGVPNFMLPNAKGANDLRNPKLVFSVIDFVDEVKWPVKYEKKQDVMKVKQTAMMANLKQAKLMIAIAIDQNMPQQGQKLAMTDLKNLPLQFVEGQKKEKFLAVLTDGVEFAKKYNIKEYANLVIDYHSITALIVNMPDVKGIMINPSGQRVVIMENDLVKLDQTEQEKKEEK